LSPRTNFFIFAVSVGIVIFLVLDLVDIHLPSAARYALALIATTLYVLLARIKAKISNKPKSKAKTDDEKTKTDLLDIRLPL